MDSNNDGRVSIDEIAMLLGAKVIEIHALQKKIASLQSENDGYKAHFAELEKPKEETVVP